jgi:cyclophilin family peptidyl-prolyl cis-trans isomerase
MNLLHLQLEQLEDRLMLSGNVNVYRAGNDLSIFGDGAANNVSIEFTDGKIFVRGTENTTINSASIRFVSIFDSDISNIHADLGSGDDQLTIGSGVRITGDVRIFAGSGQNLIGLNEVQIGDDLEIFSSGGGDSIALRQVTIGDHTTIVTSAGSDVVSFREVKTGGDVEIFSGDDEDFVVFEDSSLSGDLRIFTDGGRDTIAFKNSQVGKHLEMFLGSGNDFVSFDSTRVEKRTFVEMGSGRDSVSITGNSKFIDEAIFFGSGDEDRAANTAKQAFNNGVLVFGVESKIISDEFLKMRTTDSGGAFPKANAAQDAVGNGPEAPGTLPLRTSTASNTTTNSGGMLLTSDNTFVITGTTRAGATVGVGTDNNFNAATAVANDQGRFRLEVDLEQGDNLLKVRSTLGTASATSDVIPVYFALGTVARFDSTLGPIDVELLDADAPITVTNFLNYATRYIDSIVHRSARTTNGSDFIVQGGGFTIDGSKVSAISTDAPITNEFNSANSNVRGTLSMALPAAGPNLGTSQFFFNVADNTDLDSRLHTVFGRVIGNGMEIVDAIHALQTFNISQLVSASALTEVPLRNYERLDKTLTGTLSIATGTTTVNGVGTKFRAEIPDDNVLQIGSQSFIVSQVISDTELTVTSPATAGLTNVTGRVNARPINGNYIRFNTIDALDLG